MSLPNWIPSWLASAVLHLAAFNLLALLTLPAGERPVAPLLTVAVPGDDVDSLTDSLEAAALPIVPLDAPLAHLSAQVLAPAPHAALDDPPTLSFSPQLLDDEALTAASSDADSAAQPRGLFDEPARADDEAFAAASSARFFGVAAEGDTIVYIVDSSRSMIGPRFEAAKYELLYSIQHLRPTQKFYVYFFDGLTKPMVLGDDRPYTPAPVYATRENQALLAAWVGAVANGPWTNPSQAVASALQFHPDSLFLLTDGDFTDRGETLRILARENLDSLRRPKTTIHTIGLHSRAAEGTLKNIARRHGGVYRFIPAAR
ncbi:MAG: hypothetical protein U0939_18335 [Pirellulales bacterium]